MRIAFCRGVTYMRVGYVFESRFEGCRLEEK